MKPFTAQKKSFSGLICIIFSFFGSWILALILLIMMPILGFLAVKASVIARVLRQREPVVPVVPSVTKAHTPSQAAELAYAVSGQTTTEVRKLRKVHERSIVIATSDRNMICTMLQAATQIRTVRAAWQKEPELKM